MWYAVQVATGREESVRQVCIKYLPRDTYVDIFIIRFNRSKRYYGKWHKECEVMFPGYFFIETEEPERVYEALKKVPELTGFLGRDKEEFAGIEKNKELLFKSMIDYKYEIDISKGMIVGEQVIITEGPLVGKEGLIKKINRHKRMAILSMEMLGRVMDITVGLEIVEKR